MHDRISAASGADEACLVGPSKRTPHAHIAGETEAYVGGLGFAQFLALLKTDHPEIAALIDPRYEAAAMAGPEVAKLNEMSWEFEETEFGGRGAEYNVAQKNLDNRAQGMKHLLSLFAPDGAAFPPDSYHILDVLAGDGTLRRFAERYLDGPVPQILSGDLSSMMISACLNQGYPCIRQSATKSFFVDSCLDGVLIAYGSHHLGEAERKQAAAEAFRTLKPGRRFVLHDFETGGGVDLWFRDVVDPYSITGHPHPHFSRPEMQSLLEATGFVDIRVIEMDDPFVVRAETQDAARRKMLDHLHKMYGLSQLPLTSDADFVRLERLTNKTLGEMDIVQNDQGFVAHLMRKALVAIGTKPETPSL